VTLATVRHRTKVTNRPGSKAARIAMTFNLTETAQERWAPSAPHFVALIRAGPASNAVLANQVQHGFGPAERFK
jgi:hypothetical protein